MAENLKRDATADAKARGDREVGELPIEFDGRDRELYRLTGDEFHACMDQMSPQDIDDDDR